MMKGGHRLTKLLHAFTWDAFDHAFHAPQVRVHETITYIHVHVYTYRGFLLLIKYLLAQS